MGGGLGRVSKHPDFYLSDGSVSFLTGNTLFRVHKSFFERESEVFRDLFARAAKDDHLSGTDERPFTLDVTAHEFELFLWVWYDREYTYYQQTKDGWVTILSLSTRWEFHKIKELATRELDALQLSPAERVSIYKEYGIEGDRLMSSYVELCKSPKITKADGDLLQMETLINVLQARENAQRKAQELGHESPTSASLEDESLREIVSKYFKTSSDPRSNGPATGSGAQASDLSNGERAHGTVLRPSTITLAEPQVPERKTQFMGGAPTLTNDSLPTGSEGSQDKDKGKETPQDKKREQKEQEKARIAKEKEDKAKEAKEAMEKQKNEEKERADKAKKEVKEKVQTSPTTGRRN